MKKSKINIISELNKLKEEFSFQPRRVKERNQQKIEIHDKKLKQLQEKTPIGTVISISYFHKNKIDRYDVNDLFDNSDREYREPNLLRIDLEEDAAQEYKFVTVSEVFSVNELINDYSDILFLVKCRSLYTNEEQLCYYESEDYWRMEEDAFGVYEKGIMKYYKQEEKNSYVYEAFKFQPRRVKERQVKQEEIENKKKEQFKQEILRLENTYQNKFQIITEDLHNSRYVSKSFYTLEDLKNLVNLDNSETIRYEYPIHYSTTNEECLPDKIYYVSLQVCEGKDKALIKFKQLNHSAKTFFLCKKDEYEEYFYLKELKLIDNLNELMPKENLKEEFKFEPRRIQSRKEEKTKKLERLLQQTHIVGNLDLLNTNISDLGNLKSVEGWINLSNAKITSLGNLEKVEGHLDLSGTKITSLGNLEYVGLALDLEYCKNLTSLGNLKYVGGWIDLYNCKNLTSLGNLESVGGWIQLNNTKITYIDPSIIIKSSIYKDNKTFQTIKSFNKYYQDKQDLKEGFKFEPRRIEGRKDERNNKLNELLKQEIIEGNLNLVGSSITSLGNVKIIKGDLDAEHVNSLEDISSLEHVTGNLNLEWTNVTELPKGLRVDGNVFLKKTNVIYIDPSVKIRGILLKFFQYDSIKQFNNHTREYREKLEKGEVKMERIKPISYVAEGFKFEPRRLQSRKEEKTKRIERLLQQTHIEDDLDLSNTKITSLGNLKFVRGNLDLSNTKITSLGNLEYVGGYLYLTNTKITSLGNLEYVGGYLYLSNTKITSLGNLKSVGGNLSLRDTNITYLGNLEFVGTWIDLTNTKITYINPSIIIKGSIYKDNKIFQTIKSFNKYYQDKQNLKEEFKFAPRKIENREEKRKEREQILINKFIETYGTFEKFKTMILKELSVYIRKGLKVSIQDELYLENNKNYNITLKFSGSYNSEMTCFLCIDEDPWFSPIQLDFLQNEKRREKATYVLQKDFLKTLKRKAYLLLQ